MLQRIEEEEGKWSMDEQLEKQEMFRFNRLDPKDIGTSMSAVDLDLILINCSPIAVAAMIAVI